MEKQQQQPAAHMARVASFSHYSANHVLFIIVVVGGAASSVCRGGGAIKIITQEVLRAGE